MRFWVSWEEPEDPEFGLDPRPTSVPTDERVTYWWCSGYGEGYSTLCAVVDVRDGEGEKEARDAITATWNWDGHWRIFEEVESDWMPASDRFPVSSDQGESRQRSRWQRVMLTTECDPEGDGWCRVRNCDPSACDCIGPNQDGIEYTTIGGDLYGRRAEG